MSMDLDLEKEFERIEKFFDALSEEEFEQMLHECGNDRMKPVEEMEV